MTSQVASAPSSSSTVVRPAPQKTKPTYVKLDSLQPDSRGDNLVVKVLEVKMVLERTKFDGSKAKIAEVLVGDSTGTMILALRHEQIPLCEVGRWLTLRNTRVDMLGGHMRLVIDRWGLIEPIPQAQQPNEQINTANALSDTEFELVDQDA